jgi:hypothetical protein
VSSSLVCGQVPNVGTTFNNVSINEEFVEDFLKNLSKNIEDEL